MSSTAILGAWIAVFLTLGIFSYLYKDNPFYKTAEHLFVGVSAGYWTSIFLLDTNSAQFIWSTLAVFRVQC